MSIRQIDWKYDDMYNWFTKQHKINDIMSPDVKAIIYESKRPSKRDSTILEPFIRKNIIWTGLCPLQDDTLFPNKLFLVYDDNKNTKQNLFFVFPKQKTTQFLAADHFTFLHDTSDKKKPCHFHSTRYVYDSDRYFAGHFRDFMPDELVLPQDSSNIFLKHTQEKDFLLDLISLPWNQFQSGGTKRYTQKSKEKAEYIKDNQEFCNKWREQNVKKAVVFGIRKNNKMCWTATVYKQGRFREAFGYSGLYYETSVNLEEYDKEFQLHFLEHFEFNV